MRPAEAAADAPGVTALDALAEALLAGAGLDVRAAAGRLEREAVFRLRHQQVVEAGWVDASELPDGLERDAHDEGALHACAWNGETLVGTMRLVLPRPGRLLPVEEAFGLRVEPAGAVAEAGRLVIAPIERGDPGHRIWGALYALAWREMRPHGLTVLAGAVPPRLLEQMRTVGLPFETLGPAQTHWGQPRHPVRLDPARGMPGWFSPDQRRARSP
jgi:Acetyltransferase (GNAT) domain